MEFINPRVTGSLSVSGNIIVDEGIISARQFSGSGANLFDISASAVVGLTTSRIATGSVTASAVMNNGTGSFQINTETVITGSLFVSGGVITGIVSGSITTAETASFVKQLSQNVTITGSLFVSGGTYSGSGANLYDISASAIVGLNLARISTGSVSASAYIENGTGSVHITDNTYITGSLTANTIFANSASITHLTSVYQTSSFIYLTGSSKFGDQAGVDIHEFTGSVGITGSLAVNGSTKVTNLEATGSVGISGSLLVSGTFTVVGTDGSSLQINVPSDPTTGSLFVITDTSNNYVLEVFANRVTKITGSLAVTGNLDVTSGITGSLIGSFRGQGTGSFTGSFFGEYSGSGANLYDISASAINGLNLVRIATGSVTASVDILGGFSVNSNTTITGSLNVSGGFITGSLEGTASLAHTASYVQNVKNAETASYASSAALMDGGLY